MAKGDYRLSREIQLGAFERDNSNRDTERTSFKMTWPFRFAPVREVSKEEAAEIVELHSVRVQGEELLERFTKTINDLGVIADDKSDNS